MVAVVPCCRPSPSPSRPRLRRAAMTSFGALLLTSFKAIASLFLQYLIGATVAWFGIVKESDLRGFGAAMNYVFVPLLSIVALGRGMTADLFVRDGWVLALIGFLSMFEFATIGLLLRFVAKPSPSFRRPFVVAMALPNVVAIPLSVTQSLCEMGAFDAEFGAPGSTRRIRRRTRPSRRATASPRAGSPPHWAAPSPRRMAGGRRATASQRSAAAGRSPQTRTSRKIR